MTEPQAFKGDYVDLKFIKTRKVAQIWIEIPIEQATQFVADFGAPNPASGVPLAMARIDPNAKPVADKPKGGKLAQRAGILCGEGAFARFLIDEKYSYFNGVTFPSPTTVADFVREYCDIESRSELDHNPQAARKFLDLEASYRAWLTVAA